MVKSPRAHSHRMDDSLNELWSLYNTASRRCGPLVTSTPKTLRPTTSPNNAKNDDTVFPNENQESQLESIQKIAKKYENLRLENSALRKTIQKQEIRIKELMSLVHKINKESDQDTSESRNDRSTSLSLSLPVQRVTPTKRETSTSSTSSSRTPRAPAPPRALPASAPSNRNRASTPRRQRPSAPRTPNTTPSVVRARRYSPSSSSTPNAETPPEPSASRTFPRPQNRRRLFAAEHERPVPIQQRNVRARSEPIIEALGDSPIKDAAWSNPCPPRVHLERNRPEFIERLEARQRIIRVAAQSRAAIEERKRLAARAVATGQRSVESARNDLFADSTSIRAFFDDDVRRITMRNVQRSTEYRSRLWNQMARVDREANRIIAHTHNIRTRSQSRPRTFRT